MSDNNCYDVIIVGAGMSGISTAYNLLKKKPELKVIILEARDRIGGRIKSFSFKKFPELVIDEGAMFIHGIKSNSVYEIAKEQAGLDTVQMEWDDDDLVVGFKNGKELTEKEYKKIESVCDRMENIAYNEPKRKRFLKKNNLVDAPLEDFLNNYLRTQYSQPEKDAIPGISYEFLMQYMAKSDIVGDYGADLSSLSTKSFDQDNEAKGPDHIIEPPGWMAVIEYLVGVIGDIVRLNTVVTEIEYNGSFKPNNNQNEVKDLDPYLVKVTDSNNNEYYSKYNVVVTVPLSILKEKKIEFIPELPKYKADSINKLGYGSLNKLYLVFENCWWENEDYPDVSYIENYSASTGLELTGFINITKVLRSYDNVNNDDIPGILLCFIGGSISKNLEDKSDEDIAELAIKALNDMYKGNEITDNNNDSDNENITVPPLIDLYYTRWCKDEFSLGSYSCVTVGSSGLDYNNLRRPHGINNCLLMAGESTVRDFPGTVNGAYSSGVKAANIISKNLMN